MVSTDAALLLARIRPIRLLAILRKHTYERIKVHRDEGTLDNENRKEIRESEFASLCNAWRDILEKPNTSGEFTKLIIVPRLEAWLTRPTINGMTFHLTQVLTGHGCFSKFLCRIGKRVNTMCFLCGEDVDDVYHTLRECPMWDTQRITLRRKLNLTRDFTLGDVLDVIIASEDSWKIFSAFIEEAMKEKKDEKRRLERARKKRYTGGKLLVCDNFNSKATLWGCPYSDRRGNKLINWAASRDLRLLNTGRIPTFVGSQGFSIVDLSWAFPSLMSCVVEWSVIQDAEPLSDHAYIWMAISDASLPRERKRPTQKCWSFKRMDSDLFVEALNWYGALGPAEDDLVSASSLASWITGNVCDTCDVSTPKLGSPRERPSAYWWNDAIAACRKVSISARRQLIKSRRRGTVKDINARKLAYKTAKKSLRLQINKPKKNAWDELIFSINDDRWSLPYKIVLNRLRSASPGLTERVSARVLSRLLDSLFPVGTLPSAAEMAWRIPAWDDAWNVSISEVEDVIGKAATRNVAPEPDCLKSRAWKRVPRPMTRWLARCFSLCLKEGVFPEPWKRAHLVLIPKGPATSDDTPLKARPICLLDEAGKALERIIATRMHDWIDETPVSRLSEWKFEFRRHRSTVDALFAVRNFIEAALSAGGVAIAVSLNITNAFNSISWRVINDAMDQRKFPEYLTRRLHNVIPIDFNETCSDRSSRQVIL
ncbi:reverse transcriptase, partial [Lasius niger]